MIYNKYKIQVIEIEKDIVTIKFKEINTFPKELKFTKNYLTIDCIVGEELILLQDYLNKDLLFRKY